MEPPAERLTALYDRYHRRVLAYALLRAEPMVAEEVASETFVIAWQRLSAIPSAELPWLLGVARNLLHKQYDAAKRQRLLAERVNHYSDEADGVGWDIAEHIVDRHTAAAALAELPERYAEALTLVAWHGLTPAQAGEALGCSTTAFTVRLHRARKALRKRLRQAGRSNDAQTSAASPTPTRDQQRTRYLSASVPPKEAR